MSFKGVPPPNGGAMLYKPEGAHTPRQNTTPAIPAVRLEGVPPPNGGTSFDRPQGANPPQNTTPAIPAVRLHRRSSEGRSCGSELTNERTSVASE
jgi:hypothetical protein